MAKQSDTLIQIPDYQQIKENFLQELTLASQDKPSSISFFKHPLSKKPLISSGIVQGIVIGGTNYIVATVEMKKDGNRKMLKKQTGVLPLIKDDQTFYVFLEKHLDARAQAVGINFGFPMEPTSGTFGELDGTLLYANKEHPMFGLIGKTIGKEAKRIFKTKYSRDIPFSVANDTICLALSGEGSEQGAFIAGTGFNVGLVLQQKNQKFLVNLEAGEFNKFEPTDALKQIDAESESPGVHVFEKIISGKYLALYFNKEIQKKHPEIPSITTSQELSELSHTNHTDVSGDLARAIITRSAYLVAAAIAGAYEFCGKPKDFTLIGEGSLLWNGWKYHENIQKQLSKLGVPQDAVKIKHIKDSSINGAIGLII
jgi:hexokinase